MSLNLTAHKARLTVFGYGWDDAVIDSGDGDSDEGAALEEYVDSTEYDFPDMDWDAIADDWGLELDDYGNFSEETLGMIDDLLYDLANDADAIYDYMIDKSESTILPARIVVISPPDVTEYNEGDTIDYTGIIVAAFTSLTTMTPFINSELEGEMNNLVPYEDLTFPVTEATVETPAIEHPDYQTSGTVTVGGLADPSALYAAALGASSNTFTFKNGVESELQTFLINASGYGVLIIAENGTYPFAGWSPLSLYYSTSITEGSSINLSNSHSFTVFQTYGTRSSGSTNVKITACRTKTVSLRPFVGLSVDSDVRASNINASVEPTTVEIPVQWQTEYQAAPYEDTFDITVT